VGTELSRSEYRILVEQAPILIWRADTSGACDYFNERWLEFRGRTLAEESGNGWAEGVHAEDLDRCLKIYLTAFDARQIFEMEYRLRRHDGVYRWIFDRGAPFTLEDGSFGGYIGSCHDVTDRIAAEEALTRRRLAELAQLAELLPICSYCRKIRDDHGYWQRVEDYVSSRTMTEFTHGICPTCLATLRVEPDVKGS
jgi:PAS domain S-box-containing protein